MGENSPNLVTLDGKPINLLITPSQARGIRKEKG
jgi:hypothetical protein